MFSVDELLSKRNQRDAMTHLLSRKDGQGTDGIRISEFQDYWRLNHEMIETAIRNKEYKPGVIMTYEILNGKGKKREVSSLTVTDRFITRLLSQKLNRYCNPQFLSNSYAYQEGKGILNAVMKAQEYINAGNIYVAVVDIKDYFDSVRLDRLMSLLRGKLQDDAVLRLIESYLYCKYEKDDHIQDKKIGIVQGNSMSPVLCNLYLHELDQYMENAQYCWIRFSDDIHMYAKTQEDASACYEKVCDQLKNQFLLTINEKKSGIFSATEDTLLGYDFYKYGGKIEIRKHKYQRIDNYNNWHRCAVSKVNKEYHILQNGVLNKQDYALLFENDKEKHHIPIEPIDHLNIYSDVTISASVLRTLAGNNIKLTIVDKYGSAVGHFIPETCKKDAKFTLLQAEAYNDPQIRAELARELELAGLHNIRANLRYYKKRKNQNLDHAIEMMNGCMEELKLDVSVEQMMLIEARARQQYYQMFNQILENADFIFTIRSKRPPKDEINAMISFGNTLLYNQILQLMWNTSLNPQIGIIHAANRRNYSLHLDFADLFKPVIVDRVIFSTINRRQIGKNDFQKQESGGVLLSNAGKSTFISAFNEKMDSKIVIKNREWTYRNLILEELRKYQKYLVDKKKYKPYKYY